MLNDRPTVPEVLPLVEAYYGFEGCAAGGSLHIVLDDNNIETTFITDCIESARARHDEAGELLGRILLRMSLTQRGKLARQHSGGHGGGIDREDFLARCRALLEKYDPT